MNKKIKLLTLLVLISTSTFAQSIITGKILDQETLTPIQDVNIRFFDNSSGTTSLPDGTFQLQTTKVKAYLILTSRSYIERSIILKINSSEIDMGTIFLQPQPYSLDEISINAGLKNE